MADYIPLYYDIHFVKKSQAKSLGARWNPYAKSWFASTLEISEKLSKFFPLHSIQYQSRYEIKESIPSPDVAASKKIRSNLVLHIKEISETLPIFSEACNQLIEAIGQIKDPRWIVKKLSEAKFEIEINASSGNRNISFRSIDKFPIFEKREVGSKIIKTVPNGLTNAKCILLRELFLSPMREILTGKKNEVLHSGKEISFAGAQALENFISKRKLPIEITDTVEEALRLFRMGYTLTNARERAMKKHPYPIKSHIDKGLRLVIPEEELDLRKAEAKLRNRSPSDPEKRLRMASMIHQERSNQDHIKSI
jgi:hypothetical protein